MYPRRTWDYIKKEDRKVIATQVHIPIRKFIPDLERMVERIICTVCTSREKSGKKQEIGSVPEGTLVTANELGAVATGAYRREVATIRRVESQDAPQTLDLGWATPSKINLFISMATWCAACKRELPYLEQLRRRGGDALAIFGVPVDPEDTQHKIAMYLGQYQPPYLMLGSIEPAAREKFLDTLQAKLGSANLPSSIITDQSGKILFATDGVPTVSDLRRLGIID